MKILNAAAFFVLAATPLAAQETATRSYSDALEQSLAESVSEDIKAANDAINGYDYRLASEHLSAAAANANRLELRRVASAVAKAAPAFKPENVNFALAASSTLTFENFLQSRETAEQIYRDDDGNIVTVRVFGGDDSLKDFMFIADDPAMRDKAGLELVEMRGEPAIKRRGDDGELSVLMMSEKDHALIEIDGDSEAAVMKLIEQLEADK